MAGELVLDLGQHSIAATAQLNLLGTNVGSPITLTEIGSTGRYTNLYNIPAACGVSPLAAGEYSVFFSPRGTGTLDWDGAQEITLVTLNNWLPRPTVSGGIVGRLIAVDINNVPVQGAVFTLNFIRAADGYTGVGFDPGYITATSDVNGLVQFTSIYPNSHYQIRQGSGDWVDFLSPNDNFSLPSCTT
jgi:hypothetical protein